jgi:hypothetical protein
MPSPDVSKFVQPSTFVVFKYRCREQEGKYVGKHVREIGVGYNMLFGKLEGK